MKAQLRSLFVLVFVLLVTAWAVPPLVHATTRTVTNNHDSGAGSLRQVISDSTNGDVITFSLTYPVTITLTSELWITKNLTINGPGAAKLTLNGNNQTRIFSVDPNITVSFGGLTLANGAGSYRGDGGAIENSGTLNIHDSIFRDNKAEYDTRYGPDGNGGAIFNVGTLSVNHSTFSNNTAAGVGGAIHNSAGTLTVTNSTFLNNSSVENGGAITGGGIQITVSGSTFSGNSAFIGGAISVSTGTISDCIFTQNTASYEGGAISDQFWGPLSITGSTFDSNRALQFAGGALEVSMSVHVTVSDSTFLNNSTAGDGGGIWNIGALTVMNSTFVNNQASGAGGAINGAAKVNNTIIASTQTGDCAGGLTAGSNSNFGTDTSCSPGFTHVSSAQLALGTLTGSPAYFPLKAGSVAIDSGDNTVCPATDEAGNVRPQDGNGDGTAICDVGAYEFPTKNITRTPTATKSATRTLTPTRTPTRTLTPTRTPTHANTPTPTRTNTPTATRSRTATRTPTATKTITRTPTPSFTPDGPWIFCAKANTFCQFSGTRRVRFGANGKYIIKVYTNGVMCNVSNFGDPAVGTPKMCHYNIATVTPTT